MRVDDKRQFVIHLSFMKPKQPWDFQFGAWVDVEMA
jgi:hypothetical protein